MPDPKKAPRRRRKPPPQKATSKKKSSAENAPFCDVCQNRHWLRDPHIWK